MIDSATRSHKTLIEKFLNKDLLHTRFSKYPYIKKYFEDPINACHNKSPFYCHYMGWRLGTWTSEQPLEVFDKLLGLATTFAHWNSSAKRGQFASCAFGDYWSLLWELQVAHFFSKAGGTVSWLRTGPDFKVNYDDHDFYVECTTLRKSFEIESYIEEIFRCLGRDIFVDHIWYIPFTLPQGKHADGFLDEIFRPYLDDEYIKNKRAEAKFKYPVLLPVPTGTTNLSISLRGEDVNAYMPGIIPNYAGDPECYLANMLKEVIRNKSGSNSLISNRPNVLAVNFLLSAEYQIAVDRQIYLKKGMPTIDLGNHLDAILCSACGITDEITCPLVYTREGTHIVKLFPHNPL